MSELLVGTSGYDYDTWRGLFYPEKLAKSKYLEYYSTQFNCLELNGTYYRMPTVNQMKRMIERSSGKVRFSVKCFKDITHAKDRSQYIPLLSEFKKSLEPLIVEKLLVCALFQFPESFHYDKQERLYLDNLLKEVSDLPVVLEMRNNKWQNDNVYKELQQRNVGWCITDNPQLDNLLKLEYVRTSDIGYIRFHGRNALFWYTGDNETRYDYMYPDCELKTFVSPILELLNNTKVVMLFFNNHAKSQSVVNAKMLEMLLKSSW